MANQGFGNCGGNMQASHIKSEGAWPNLRLDPHNIFPHCYRHHIFVWHKDTTESVAWFIKTFPKEYAYLEKAKNEHIDFNNIIILEKLWDAVQLGYLPYRVVYNEIAAEKAPKKS